MLKIGVVGLGYLGNIHLKCLEQTDFEISGVYDIDKKKTDQISKKYGLTAFDSLDELINESDAISIVTDTSAHCEIAQKAINSNVHVFVEKPLSSNISEARELNILAKGKPHLKIQVGHIERYNPAFINLDKSTLNPQFVEIHRLAQYNERGTDVSVVMDLMIHDLDALMSILPYKVVDIQAKGVKLFSKHADICNARLSFENGCVVNITASRISLKSMRKMRIFQEDAYINIDFLEKQSQLIRLDENQNSNQNAMSIETQNGTKYISIETITNEEQNAIVLELQDFYESIVNDSNVSIGVDDAIKAIDLANRIEEIANKT